MCKFFSVISDGNGNMFYFNAEQRKTKKLKDVYESFDSHTSIANFFKMDEDKCNKYEFIPLTREFTVDQVNTTTNDAELIKMKLFDFDIKLVIPELIIKPIIHPFKVQRSNEKVTTEEIKLLKEWIKVVDSVRNSVGYSVRNSVWNSVGASVWESVRNSVWESVRNSVWNSVENSVENSVWNSVWDSVGDSVGASVWNSVWNSVYAYTSSFFDIKYKHDFSSGIKLWEAGLVPSFDGTTWRLHAGETAKVIYEMKVK